MLKLLSIFHGILEKGDKKVVICGGLNVITREYLECILHTVSIYHDTLIQTDRIGMVIDKLKYDWDKMNHN